MQEHHWNTIQTLDDSWSRPETEYLLSLLELFHGNFVLVHDRFDQNKFKKTRSIEDLKERSFQVLRLCHGSALNEVYFDKQNEEIRRLRTERYLSRNSCVNKKEEELVSLIKKVELKISKREREERGIRKMLDLTCEGIKEEQEGLGKLKSVEEILKQKFSDLTEQPPAQKYRAFSRSSLMKPSVPKASALLNQKLETCLKTMKLNVLNVHNEQTHDLFDALKKKFVRLLMLKAFHEKKLKQKQILEEMRERQELLVKRPAIQK